MSKRALEGTFNGFVIKLDDNIFYSATDVYLIFRITSSLNWINKDVLAF